MSQTRLVAVRQNVLNKNDVVARSLRERFEREGICTISLVSSPGSGKTALLEQVLTTMRKRFRVAALVGDLATDNDAVRLARSQAPVKQIQTGTICHLDASMVVSALDEWHPGALEFLFIENVGNLVCPASYDLGENARIVLLSVTEGEDKSLKYPTILQTADAVVFTKIDLAAAVEFDQAAAHRNVQAIRSGVPVHEVSVKTGEGMEGLLEWIAGRAGRAAPLSHQARALGVETPTG